MRVIFAFSEEAIRERLEREKVRLTKHGLKPLSLRHQLLLFVIAVMVPSTALVAVALRGVVKAREDDASARLRAQAELAAARLEIVLQERRALLERLASELAASRTQPLGCAPMLQDFTRLHPEFVTLSIRLRDGTLLCSTLPNPNTASQMRGFDWFQAAARSPGFSVSDAWRGAITGRWSIILAQPLNRLDDAGGAMILLPVDLVKLSQLVMRDTLDTPGCIVTVLDRRGVVLLRSANPQGQVGSPESIVIRKTVADGTSGSGVATDPDGQRQSLSYVTLPATGWRVVASLPESVVFADAHALLWKSLVAGVAVLLILLWMAWHVARRVIEPITALSDLARRVAAGDTAARGAIEGPPEVASVVRQLNAMLDTRQQSEHALEESEYRLLLALKGANDGWWDWDLVAQRLFYSPRWWEMLGYRPDELPADPDLWRRLMHPDDVEATELVFAHALASAMTQYEVEFRLLHKDRHYVPMLSRGYVERDACGRAIRVSGTNTDLTTRRAAEEALRASEEQHRFVVDHMAAGLMVYGGDGVLQLANPRAFQLLGMRGEDAVGRHWNDVEPEFLDETGRRLARVGHPIARVMRSRQPLDGCLVGLDSRRSRGADAGGRHATWLSVDAHPQFDATQRLAHVIVSFVDVSARRSAEREQQRLNRALRVVGSGHIAAGETRDEGAYLGDVCAAVVRAGGYVMAWVGFARDDADKSIRVMAQAGDAEGYLARASMSWDGQRTIGQGPTGVAIRTGRTQVNQNWETNPQVAPWRALALRSGFGSSVAIPLGSGPRPFGALTLYAPECDAFDSSEVVPLEELARNLTLDIEYHRARREREVAESASRAKSAFLANMSHEIRTPLTAIIGLNYLLRRDGVTPKQSARLDKIDAASTHLLSILNDILDLSKIEAGRVQLDLTDFSLSAVLDHVHDIIVNAARDKGLAVEVAGDTVPPWLRGDPTRLRQSLLNFASNALKFTERGRIVLRALLLEEDDDGLRVRFDVEDTGPGLAPDVVARLFQPFEQGDVSTSRRFGGTGLGLVITQRLATLMGGECGVESQEDSGSTFWFTARLQRGEGTPLAGPDGSDAAESLLRQRHAGARVLLAEDNMVNQEIVQAIMQAVGIQVRAANDGREALALASTAQYDLVLMDMQMPHLDGLEATRALRAMPAYAHVPILALTANAFDEDRRACRTAGMDDCLVKPVEPGTFYATVLRWLDAARADTTTP